MAIIDTFTGRTSPVTNNPVTVTLLRLFNPNTLSDVWAVHFDSGNKHEEYNNLSPAEANNKYKLAQLWWL